MLFYKLIFYVYIHVLLVSYFMIYKKTLTTVINKELSSRPTTYQIRTFKLTDNWAELTTLLAFLFFFLTEAAQLLFLNCSCFFFQSLLYVQAAQASTACLPVAGVWSLTGRAWFGFWLCHFCKRKWNMQGLFQVCFGEMITRIIYDQRNNLYYEAVLHHIQKKNQLRD